MVAPPHYIRANLSSALPQRIIYLDTETLPHQLGPDLVEHRLRLGVACYTQRASAHYPEREDWLRFKVAGELFAWIERKMASGRRLVLLAHNTGFDLQAIGGPAALVARGWRLTKAPLIDQRTIIRAAFGGGSLLVLDFTNYFPTSLAHIGRLLGLDKHSLPLFEEADPVWFERCTRDVQLLREAFERWLQLVETERLGHFAETLPKQAWNGYRHRWMDHQILVHKQSSVAALERLAYFGGRTECLFLGVAPARAHFKLDANSHYAAVMRDGLFPTRLRYYVQTFAVSALARLVERHLIIAQVEIETDLPIYPMRYQGRLTFPVGRFLTTLATPELVEAASRGHLRRIGHAAIYDGAPIFARWVGDVYAVRLAAQARGDQFTAELAKRLLTALFGRFGMRTATWEKVDDEPERPDELYKVWDADDHRMRTFRRLGGRLDEQREPEDADSSFVAIPAHVTSAARLRLWRWVEQAGIDHTLYTDTDALIVDEHGYQALASEIDATRLGALKVEGWSTHVRIDAPKVYEFGSEQRHKGRRDDAIDMGDGRYRQQEWVGMRAALAMQHVGGPLVRYVDRLAARARVAGTVTEAGRVLPLRLGDR